MNSGYNRTGQHAAGGITDHPADLGGIGLGAYG
jgi:hypothetical protein